MQRSEKHICATRFQTMPTYVSQAAVQSKAHGSSGTDKDCKQYGLRVRKIR